MFSGRNPERHTRFTGLKAEVGCQGDSKIQADHQQLNGNMVSHVNEADKRHG